VQSAHNLIRILTVDDHPILRKGLAALVNAELDLKIGLPRASQWERSHRGISMSSARHNANGSTNAWAGRDSSNRGYLQCVFREREIIVLTTYTGDNPCGARPQRLAQEPLCSRGHVLDELLDTIRAVACRKEANPSRTSRPALADHAIDDALTEREIDVLRLIAGNGNKQIADELSISEATVEEPCY